MGILQTVNHERDHMRRVGKSVGNGELPDSGLGSFTAYLNVRYLKPVQTSTALVVVARYVKREGRKDFINAEIRQAGEGKDCETVLCATGEALFVVPKASNL
jgi:acyl-coenzyme A thioesterase PaaI-like protein